jgi:hypothetical protein
MEIMALHDAGKALMRGPFDHFSDGPVRPRMPMPAWIIGGSRRNHRHAWSFCVRQPERKPIGTGGFKIPADVGDPPGRVRAEGNHTMAILPTPEPTPTPAPTPPPFPEPKPVREPDPDRLPDEAPVPNPDENDAPLKIGPKTSNSGI